MTMQYGKLSPQAVELEELVLGACLLDSRAIYDILDILAPDDFYKEGHQQVYGAMLSLFESQTPIDLATVTEQLRKQKSTVSAFDLVTITNRVGSAANVEHHARIIKEKSVKRSVITVASNALKQCYDDGSDTFKVVDKLVSQLNQTIDDLETRGLLHVSQYADKAAVALEQQRDMSDDSGVKRLKTDIGNLDMRLKGLKAPDLLILAARPGMGKSAFAFQVARNVAISQAATVAIFSLEMSAAQIMIRMAAQGLEAGAVRSSHGYTDHEIAMFEAELSELLAYDIYIDESGFTTVSSIRSKCQKLKSSKGLDLVVIDYLQLINTNTKGNRNEQVGEISRSLKRIAKEFDVPVLALAQLSRAVEQRGGDKRPMLSDLRESGSIEQDADVIAFLYRPSYYGILSDADGQDVTDKAEFIVSKFRGGEPFTENLRWTGSGLRFSEFEQHPF